MGNNGDVENDVSWKMMDGGLILWNWEIWKRTKGGKGRLFGEGRLQVNV